MRSAGKSLIICAFMLSSCKDRQFSDAKPSEAFNEHNNPLAFGLPAEVLNWEISANLTQGQRSRPWSDSYWPTVERGLLWRWNAQEKRKGSALPFPRSPWEQLQELSLAASSRDATLLASLSPAEKHDYLVSGMNIPAEKILALKAIHDRAETSGALAGIVDLQTKLRAIIQEGANWDALDHELSLLNFKMLMKAAKGEVVPELDRNHQSKLTEKLAASDEQWSAAEQAYLSAASKHNSLIATFSGDMLKAMNNIKLNYSLPLVNDGWTNWLENMAERTEGEWTWEGICHGWSSAALLEESPKQSVLASYNGREVLFLQGDIRGLLSKLWAGQTPPNSDRFLGQRCGTAPEDITTSAGRIVDGKICSNGDEATCKNGRVIRIKEFVANSHVVYAYPKTPDTWKRAKIANRLGSDFFRIDTGEGTGNRRLALLHYTAGCRDTNAAAFHLSLVDLIGRKKSGFVFDIDRGFEVWNQPVFGYEFISVPIALADGKLSRAGELVPVEKLAPSHLSAVRSPGTKFVIQIITRVEYGIENNPQTKYEASDDKGASQVFAYTLELDGSKKILGGEWGLLPGITVDEAMRHKLAIENAPDFIWYLAPRTNPQEGPVKKDILKQIHKCSLETKSDGTMTLSNGENISYVKCEVQ